jgi:hypothetical protein
MVQARIFLGRFLLTGSGGSFTDNLDIKPSGSITYAMPPELCPGIRTNFSSQESASAVLQLSSVSIERPHRGPAYRNDRTTDSGQENPPGCAGRNPCSHADARMNGFPEALLGRVMVTVQDITPGVLYRRFAASSMVQGGLASPAKLNRAFYSN